MTVESLPQCCGSCFNKECFVLTNNTVLLKKSNGAINQVPLVTQYHEYGEGSKKCCFKNILNFLLIVSCLVFFIMVEFYGYGFQVKPGFSCLDPSISYKRQSETVSFWVLMSGSLVLMPTFYLVVISFLNEGFTKKGMWEILLLYKEYWKGMLLVLTISEAFKALILEPRPDFLDVCNPDKASNCTSGEYVEFFNCQNSEKYGTRKMFDANRSFPSGHATLSLFSSTFSWYLVESRFPSDRMGEGLKLVLLVASLAWSMICSLSRITDKRHHWWDVLGGALIGVVCGVYTIYSLYKKFDRKKRATHIRSVKNCTENGDNLDEAIDRKTIVLLCDHNKYVDIRKFMIYDKSCYLHGNLGVWSKTASNIVFMDRSFMMDNNETGNTEPLRLLNSEAMDTKCKEIGAGYISKNNNLKGSWTPIVLNIIFGIAFFAIYFPFNRGYVLIPKTGFFCKDPSISYKHQDDTVKTRDVLILSWVFPIIFLAVLEPLRSLNISKKRFLCLWLIYADFLLCGLLCWVLMILVKVVVGYPRPDFLDVCQPDLASNCTPGEYVENFKCQKSRDPYTERLSISSFFSGHALAAVYAAIFSMLVRDAFAFVVLGIHVKHPSQEKKSQNNVAFRLLH